MDFSTVPSPVIFAGDATTAYRDPAAVFHDDVFHLFFTLVRTDPAGGVRLFVAKSHSRDFLHWSAPRILTPGDPKLNFSSPGSIVRFHGRWVMCLQTYPRPGGIQYGDETSRLWTVRSDDLEHWDRPRLLKVKGPGVDRERMGRMIDPYLFRDRDDPDKWWCFYKQNGVSMSWSNDLETWHDFGRVDGGENSCVIVDSGQYVLFHSPDNGIGVKRSPDLVHWTSGETCCLGQAHWPWARGRLTAGFVLDLRACPRIGKAILFFHGSGPEDERTMFDTHASIAFAWSNNLADWDWADRPRP